MLGMATLTHGQRPDVLIGNDYENISGFGGVFLSFVPLGGKMAAYTGGGGAVLMDNAFYLGGYGMGLTDDRKVTVDGARYAVDLSHGGFIMGFNLNPERIFHLSISSRLGWGTLEYNALENNIANISDKVFVVHPSVEAEFNMTHWFKINGGVGYQQVIGVDDFYYDTGDASGPAISVSFLFGWFY